MSERGKSKGVDDKNTELFMKLQVNIQKIEKLIEDKGYKGYYFIQGLNYTPSFEQTIKGHIYDSLKDNIEPFPLMICGSPGLLSGTKALFADFVIENQEKGLEVTEMRLTYRDENDCLHKSYQMVSAANPIPTAKSVMSKYRDINEPKKRNRSQKL
jgi:hypothetical protein